MRGALRTPARQWAATLACTVLATLLLSCIGARNAPRAWADVGLAPPVAGRVLDGFAPPAQRWLAGHRGVDLAAEIGDPVRSATAGVVVFAGVVAGTPTVSVQLPDGRRTTHQPVLAVVVVGQAVAAGQILGELAAGSHCAVACLHWGLLRGKTYENPLSLVGVQTDTRTRGPVRLWPAGHKPSQPPPGFDPGIGMPMAVGARQPGTFSRPAPGPISSPFGMRFHPVRGIYKLHDGTDFAAACGTPVQAAATGRVVESGYSAAWGNRVVVDHGVVAGARVRTTYNHLSAPGAAVGSVVARGQVLGIVGTTGFSTGCHLHFGMERNGSLVDPMGYLR